MNITHKKAKQCVLDKANIEIVVVIAIVVTIVVTIVTIVDNKDVINYLYIGVIHSPSIVTGIIGAHVNVFHIHVVVTNVNNLPSIWVLLAVGRAVWIGAKDVTNAR